MGLFDFLPGFQKETPPDGFVRASHVLFLAEEYADAATFLSVDVAGRGL